MRRWSVTSTLLLAACHGVASSEPDDPKAHLAVTDLRADGQVDPLGLDGDTPHLSWRLRAKHHAAATELEPSAYQVIAASCNERSDSLDADLWVSSVVEAGWRPSVPYGGPTPQPGDAVFWRARVRDGSGRWSAWSQTARFVQGPRTAEDWPGPWLVARRGDFAPWPQPWLWHPEAAAGPPPPGTRFFRAQFAVTTQAPGMLIAHADDQLTVWLNGEEVARGGSYDTALRADVSLRSGTNIVAVAASNLGLAANPAGVSLELRSGHATILGTADAAWRCSDTATPRWRESDFDASTWQTPIAVAHQAEWAAAVDTARRDPDPVLRRSFALTTAPTSAMLHVASVGYHEVRANGVALDGPPLAPHVSHLGRRARYTTHELTGLLRAGHNTLDIALGRGWSQFAPYGHQGVPAARVRLDLRFADGSRQVVASDDQWQWRPGARTLLGAWRFREFGGERVDAARDTAPDDSGAWQPATVTQLDIAISGNRCAPNRLGEALIARSITTHDDGSQTADLGRAAAGLLQVVATGRPSTTIRIAVSERDDQTVTYAQNNELLLRRDGTGEFRSAFNHAAGRWVTTTGAAPLRPSDVRLHPISTGLTQITSFACSDDRLNALHEVAVWTLRNLMAHGYLVDCPHRERLGYGGDAHATAPALLSHFDATAFCAKWLQDWRDTQNPDGSLPHSAPTMLGGGGPAWGGICATLALAAYVESGDTDILRDNLPMVRRYVAWLEGHVQDGLLQPHGDAEWGFLGDWVPPGYGQDPARRVPAEWTLFFNNCYRLELLTAAARIAHALGEHAEANTYGQAAIESRAAIRARFVAAPATFLSDARQPYLALGLRVGVLNEEHDGARSLLVAALRARDGHVDAGIHGTHYLLEQLTSLDRDDLALAMVGKVRAPGWLHMLEQGSTTLWEQWDGEHSRLHASFVSVATWFVRGLAGIRPDPAWPGYERFIIAPTLGHLRWLRCRHDCVRGTIECDWHRDDHALMLTVTVPPGASARLMLPVAHGPAIRVDGALATATERAPGRVTVNLGAGRHSVSATLQ